MNEREGSKEPEDSVEKKHKSVERMLSAELQERREADALKRAEDAERRKEEVPCETATSVQAGEPRFRNKHP